MSLTDITAPISPFGVCAPAILVEADLVVPEKPRQLLNSGENMLLSGREKSSGFAGFVAEAFRTLQYYEPESLRPRRSATRSVSHRTAALGGSPPSARATGRPDSVVGIRGGFRAVILR